MPTNTREEDGFTLVELLIVILIIGILAAIAVPTLMATRGKANQSAATSDLRNAVTAENAYAVAHPTFTDQVADLTAEGYKTSTGVTPVHVKLVGSTFIACVKHAASPSWLVYNGASGATTTSSSDCA